MAERWTRGAGSGGIGTSGHLNGYRSGVLVGNFVEDGAEADFAATGRHVLGLGEPFRGQTTHRLFHNEYGKTGAELAFVSQRLDKDHQAKAISGDVLMRHGDFWAPRESYYATLNQLTFPTHRFHGEPRVQTHVWADGNTHNSTVTRNTQNLGLTTTKTQQWRDEGTRSGYETTTRSALHSAALPAAENPTRTQTIRLTTGSGHEGQIGRKPIGPHRDECDKNYRRTGLRGKYYSGNMS